MVIAAYEFNSTCIVVSETTDWQGQRNGWVLYIAKVSLHLIKVMWRNKDYKDDCFLLSPIFDLAFNFPQKSKKSAKSFVVLFLKGQLFISEDHGICENR